MRSRIQRLEKVEKVGLKRSFGSLVPFCVFWIFIMSGMLSWSQAGPKGMNVPRELREALLTKDRSSLQANAPLQIQLLSPKVSLKASSLLGGDNSPSQLRLRLRANQPGWTVGLVASDLSGQTKSPKARISANEVLARQGQNATYRTLQNPVPMVLNVPVRSQDVNIDLKIASSNTERPLDNYQGEILLLASHSSGLKMEPISVTVDAEVTCRVIHTWKNDKLYFHFASLPDSLTGAFKGELAAEAPVILTLSSPNSNSRVDQIPVTKPFQTHERPNSEDIPPIGMKWQLREGSGPLRNPESIGSAPENTISWLLRDTPSDDMRYELNCTVEPGEFQAAGCYGTTLVLTLTPQL